MTTEETRLRDEFVQIIRPWFEVAMNSAIPEPWDVSEHCAARAADAILIRLRGEADYHRARAERLAGALEHCRRVLLMLTEPKAIRSTSVANAWAQAVDAELKARQALAQEGEG